MKKETKINILFSITFLILGVIFGIVIAISIPIPIHKKNITLPTTEQTTSETAASTTETVKATPLDKALPVLLKVKGQGFYYLENEGYVRLTNNRYGMAPGKCYMEDYALELKTANAYGTVSTQYIWVSEYNKNELLNSGYFEDVEYK